MVGIPSCMIAAMPTTTVMKVSGNGQVSLPAATRARWRSERVVVVDLGDHVVMRPVRADAVGELKGKYSGRASSAALRRAERDAQAAAERRGR